MTTVAEQWTSHNGWWRPKRDDGLSVAQWGWTNDPEQADPSYLATARPIGDTVTEISADGQVMERPRQTETMGYPLPPEAPRFKPKWNRWKQYTLPDPATGRETAAPRATTIAGTLDDKYNLGRWQTRMAVAAVLKALQAQAAPVTDPPAAGGKADQLALLAHTLLGQLDGTVDAKVNDTIDRIVDLCGGRDAAEFGTAVHAWLEAVDLGMVRPRDVPAIFQPHLQRYRQLLKQHGLEAVPEYVERIVFNDAGTERVVGTLDRIYRVRATGELILGDLKTSKSLDFGWLEYAIQLSLYCDARLMLMVDGSDWEPMPPLNAKMALLVHVPSDNPSAGVVVPFDMAYGRAGAVTAMDVRGLRRGAAKAVPYKHAIPIPSKDSLLWCDARHAIQDISDPSELATIWEQYQDVWTDDLTQLGRQIAALITQGVTA